MQEQKLIPAGKPELSFMINTTSEASNGQASSPPLLTGGVSACQKIEKNKGVDWLSVSLPVTSATSLVKRTKKTDGLAYAKGFEHHELRDCWGGQVQRHYKPYSKSAKWGSSYELWSWTGQHARKGLNEMRAGAVDAGADNLGERCTRLDVAFDLRCELETSPAEIVEGFRQHTDDLGVKCGIYSEGDVLSETRYVGVSTADRRIRIYRKDIESPMIYVLGGDKEYFKMPPTIRIELVLKREKADYVYQIALKDENSAFALCAGEIQEMIGLQLSDDVSTIPTIPDGIDSDLAFKLACLVNQYGVTLQDAKDAGVSLDGLLRLRDERLSERGHRRQRRASRANVGRSSAEIEAVAMEIYRERF